MKKFEILKICVPNENALSIVDIEKSRNFQNTEFFFNVVSWLFYKKKKENEKKVRFWQSRDSCNLELRPLLALGILSKWLNVTQYIFHHIFCFAVDWVDFKAEIVLLFLLNKSSSRMLKEIHLFWRRCVCLLCSIDFISIHVGSYIFYFPRSQFDKYICFAKVQLSSFHKYAKNGDFWRHIQFIEFKISCQLNCAKSKITKQFYFKKILPHVQFHSSQVIMNVRFRLWFYCFWQIIFIWTRRAKRVTLFLVLVDSKHAK